MLQYAVFSLKSVSHNLRYNSIYAKTAITP
jgi:hypothetical protein